jgi:hypothetical protein
VARRASEIERRSVEWLEPGRIPRSAVSLLVGVGGLGKSQLVTLLAARVSRGELGGAPSVVLIASAEDDPATTIRPRLEAAGADLDRVRLVHVDTAEGEDGLALPDDVAELEQLASDLDPRLVIVDPLVAHLPVERVDAHRDQSVRRALAPLARLASDRRLAVVGIVHLNKSVGLAPLFRVSGSAGFANAARSVLLLDRDPDDPEGESGCLRVLAHVKCNVGPLAPSLGYRVAQVVLPSTGTLPDVVTSRLELIGESPHGGSALLMAVDDETRTALEDAEEFLRGELEDGSRHLAVDLLRDARRLGIADRTLRRARRRIGAHTEKAGFGRGWEWWIPSAESDGFAKGPRLLAPSQAPDTWPLRENGAAMRVSDPSEAATSPEGANSRCLAPSNEIVATTGNEKDVRRVVLELAAKGVPVDEIVAFTCLPKQLVRDALTPSLAETGEAGRRLQAQDSGPHARPRRQPRESVARMRLEQEADHA